MQYKSKNRIFICFIFIFIMMISYKNVFAEDGTKSFQNRLITSEKIVEVIDLDKLRDSSDRIIKLYGVSIDCYKKYNENFKEGKTNFQNGYEFGISKPYFNGLSIDENYNNGINFLKQSLLNKEVTLQLTDNDRYNVLVNGESINTLLIRNGYATLDNNIKDKDFLEANKEASSNKVGLWKVVINSKLTRPPGESSSPVFKVIQFITIILIITAFLLCYRKYSLQNMIFFYISVLSNIIIMGLYDHSENFYLLIINISVDIIFTILSIYFLCKYTFFNKKAKFINVIINMILVVIFIITFFGGIYQNYSMNQIEEETVKYSLPYFELLSSDSPGIPINEYLAVPQDYYKSFNSDGKLSSIYNLSIIDATYFSATTFFTVGYGDITPRGNLRVIAMLEMLVGYFLQIVLFSSIVTNIFNKLNSEKYKLYDNTKEEKNPNIEEEGNSPMKEINFKEEYDELFPNIKEKGEEKSKRERALEHALDIRKFEIEMYWKRASYFWTFIGATLAGYFLLLKNANDPPKDILMLLNCLGFAFSISWYFVNRGSKFWQNNWERHVDMLEDEFIGPLYKTAIDVNMCSAKKLHKEYGFSVSKVNQILSLYVIFIWMYLGVKSFSIYYNFQSQFENYGSVMLVLMTVIFTVCLFIFSKTTQRMKLGKKGEKLETRFLVRNFCLNNKKDIPKE